MWWLAAVAFAADPVLLDAGPLADLVMPGFQRLDLEGATDGRVRWELRPDKAHAGAFPDPLAGDALSGGRLHVDVEAGRWRVWVMLGEEPLGLAQLTAPFGLRVDGEPALALDPPEGVLPWQTWTSWLASPWWSANPRPVFRAGETSWDRQTARVYRWHELTLDVPPGGVDLQAFGRPLQALVMAPEGGPDPMPEIEAARRDFFHRHFHPLVESELPAVADELTQAGWEQGPGAPVKRWSLQLAQDERQGTVLWLPGDEPVQVHVSGLEPFEVELYEVSWLDASQHALRPTRVRPAVLIPRGSSEGTLGGGQGLPVGLAVVVRAWRDACDDCYVATPPRPTGPGRYRGRVELVQGGRRHRVDLRIEVLDLQLPPPTPSGFIWLVPPSALQLLPPPEPVLPEVEQGAGRALTKDLLAHLTRQTRHDVLQDELQRMRLLGATAITLKGALPVDRQHRAPDLRLAEFLLQRWANSGGTIAQWADPKMIIRQNAFVHPQEDPLPDALEEPVRALLQVPARTPIPVVIPVWEEEGGWKNADAVGLARALMPQLRALAPGVRFAANAGHPLDHTVAGLIDVVTLGNVPTLRRSIVAQVRAQGSTAWAYNLAPAETGPLAAWANDVEAFVQWHWSPAIVDPFHDLHARPTWWYGARGPDGQVWHTALAERFAAGITLTRWLRLIEQQLQAAPDAEAQALLDAIRASLDGPLPNSTWEGEALAPSSVAALRPVLIETALRLRDR